jgi:hypothetical protein
MGHASGKLMTTGAFGNVATPLSVMHATAVTPLLWWGGHEARSDAVAPAASLHPPLAFYSWIMAILPFCQQPWFLPQRRAPGIDDAPPIEIPLMQSAGKMRDEMQSAMRGEMRAKLHPRRGICSHSGAR